MPKRKTSRCAGSAKGSIDLEPERSIGRISSVFEVAPAFLLRVEGADVADGSREASMVLAPMRLRWALSLAKAISIEVRAIR
jgi:hypothetical protein